MQRIFKFTNFSRLNVKSSSSLSVCRTFSDSPKSISNNITPQNVAPTESKCQQVSNTPSLYKTAISTGIDSFLAISTLTCIHYGIGQTDETIIFGPFGATAVLLFGFPAAPFSQPRNIIGGHFIGAACGLSSHMLIGVPMDSFLLSAPVAVATASTLMMLTKSFHPPAGGTALTTAIGSAKISSLGYYFLVPTVGGSVSLVILAYLFNRISGGSYPQKWF